MEIYFVGEPASLTWFVLRTRSGHESSIVSGISSLGDGYRSFCPVYRTIRIVRGRKVPVEVPLWSTYVLADWPDDGGISWHRVMDLDGVSGVIGGASPMPVAEREIQEVVDEAGATGVVTSMDLLLDRIRRGYGRGDSVRIEGGSFNGAVGTCNWYDGSGVSVKIALLGRDVNVYASLASGALVVKDDVAVINRSKARRTRRRLMRSAGPRIAQVIL